MFKTELLEANMTWQEFDEIALFPLDQMDALFLINRLAAEIQNTGGSRQRDEGVKLLKRIRTRYLEDFNRRSRLAAEASLSGAAI